jgi:ADP-ribosyl-[dinitrogen reductase] hydrolase
MKNVVMFVNSASLNVDVIVMGARPSSLDKFQGCILGAAIGDALGAPYEFQRSGIQIDESGYGVGVFNTEPGAPTDDSTLMRFHAEAWLESNNPTEIHHRYMEKLVKWFEGNPKDMGNQTRMAIKAWIDGKPAPDGGSCGNGSLMAVAPAGLLAKNPIEAGVLGYNFSEFTHPNELCRYACGTFAHAIYSVSRTDGKDAYFPRMSAPRWFPTDGNFMGFVATTAGIAFEALNVADDVYSVRDLDPKETGDFGFQALKWVIGRGGDTDTNASVAGALIGAYYGMAAWREPEWLVATLQDSANWLKLAEDLYDLNRY